MVTPPIPANPNVPKQIDPKTTDIWLCANGEPHRWLYRRDQLSYFCPGCKGSISKHDLKKATDLIA